jgi:uncharacterized protein YaeQ
MALPSTRLEFRIALAHVDRGVERAESVVVARHPSETAEHVMLRVLAWCLLPEEGLEFGPGLCDPEAADLWARDLAGRTTAWIECGAAAPEKLRRVIQHHAGAAVHVVVSDDERAARARREELAEALAGWRRAPRGFAEVTWWSIDPALVQALATVEERRQRWSVTVVGDHLYIEADGRSLDGAVTRTHPPTP